MATVARGRRGGTGRGGVERAIGNDAQYLEQKAAIARALADYQSQYTTEANNAKLDYDARNRVLGTQRTRANRDLANDFAGRGMLHSGLYARDLGEQNTDYNDQAAEMTRALASFNSNLAAGRTNFITEQQLALRRAQQEALARRAAGLGLV